MPPGLSRALRVILQTGALWLVFRLAEELVAAWQLPLPAAVLGIAILFTLFSLGIVKEEWLADACELLMKHLAFFFIPVAVGIMAFRQLLWQHAFAFAFVVIACTVLGVAVTGRIGAGAAAPAEDG